MIKPFNTVQGFSVCQFKEKALLRLGFAGWQGITRALREKHYLYISKNIKNKFSATRPAYTACNIAQPTGGAHFRGSRSITPLHCITQTL